MLSLLHALCFAYSGGGGEGGEGQTCDAIGLCDLPWEGGVVSCPPGMTMVAPPERSDVYSVSSPTTTYVSSELVEIHVRVTVPLIQAKRNAGVLQCSCNSTVDNCALGYLPCDETLTEPYLESSKYIGLLLYAVREGDEAEAKVGEWEIPAEIPPRFHTPIDGSPETGCGGRALMHANANAKNFFHRFHLRSPPAGSGTLVVRALFKQGDTNGGAFYWAGGGAGGGAPTPGAANGDLRLQEAAAPPRVWFRGAPLETCAEACARHGLGCDEAVMAAAATDSTLPAEAARHHVCRRPQIAACDAALPAATNLPDDLCWAWPHGGAAACPADGGAGGDSGAAACDARPTEADRLRLCACGAGGRRLAAARALEAGGSTDGEGVGEGVGADTPRRHKPGLGSGVGDTVAVGRILRDRGGALGGAGIDGGAGTRCSSVKLTRYEELGSLQPRHE